MRDIDEMLPQVLPYVPTCPEPLVHRFLREASRQVCHNVRLWREFDTITVSKPGCIGFTTVPDADIVEIQNAQLDGHNLQVVTVAWLDAERPGWGYEDPEDPQSARYVTQLNPNSLVVFPQQAGTVKVRLVLQPSLTAMTLPDNLVELHGTTIGRGAASLALMHPVGDFANPQLGLTMYSEFTSKISSLKTEFTKGQIGARLRTKGDWF